MEVPWTFLINLRWKWQHRKNTIIWWYIKTSLITWGLTKKQRSTFPLVPPLLHFLGPRSWGPEKNKCCFWETKEGKKGHGWWLKCPAKPYFLKTKMSTQKKDILSSNHQFSGDVLVFTGTNLLGIFTPNQKPLSEMSTLRSEIFWSPSYRRWCLPIGVSTLSGFSLGQTACVSFAPCLCRRPRTLGRWSGVKSCSSAVNETYVVISTMTSRFPNVKGTGTHPLGK